MKRRTFITSMFGAALGLGTATVTGAAPRLLDDLSSTVLAIDTHGGRSFHQLLLTATATVTGLTEGQVRTELQAGKSLEQVAVAKGKTAAEVVASARATLKTKLDQEVAAKTITQAQADQKLANFDSSAPQAMQQVGAKSDNGRDAHAGGKPKHVHQLLLSATATVTGLTEGQVRTELQAGKSLEQVAVAKGKTAAEVIASARATLKTKLDQEVAAKTITQAQADQKLANFDSSAPQAMQQVGAKPGNGRDGKPGHGRGTKPGTGSGTTPESSG